MNPILIGYDGSQSAKHAVAVAGQLFGGREAVILTAFEDWPSAAHADAEASAYVDSARGETARLANEGAELARQAGLHGRPQTVFAPRKPWQSIVAVADELDAALIVTGSHGMSGLRPLVLGSVSHQLAHHSHRPVLSVPAPDVAAARRHHTTQVDATPATR